MRVAIIGSVKSIDYVQSILSKKYSFIDIEYFTFKKYTDVVEILNNFQNDFDSILFTGKTTYIYAINFAKSTIPWSYVPRNKLAFLSSLIQSIKTYNVDISKISIDSYDKNAIYESYLEMGYDKDDLDIYGISYDKLSEKYLDYVLNSHKEHFYSNKVNLCLTGINSVYEELLKLDIPCNYVTFSSDLIIESLNKLRLNYHLEDYTKDSIVFFYISVNMIDTTYRSKQSDLKFLKANHKIIEKIHMYAQMINAATFLESTNNFYLFTTKSNCTDITNNLTNFELFDMLQSDSYIDTIYMGIGLSCDMLNAKKNCELANSKSKLVDFSNYFIVDDLNDFIGPISPVSKDYQLDNSCKNNLIFISNKTGVSLSKLFIINEIINQNNLTSITPKDLARLCGFNFRSTNRILAKLESHGYVTLIGKDLSGSSGRPSRLISINLNN